MRYDVILFDLDGTLTDPAEGITKSVQHALARLGIASQPEELRHFIGPPLHHSFSAHYGFDAATVKLAVEHYREYFGQRGIFENRMYEGVPGLLSRLRENGATLCLVSSKPAVYCEKILAHFDLDAYFDGVVGPGLDLADAEKTVLVAEALRRYQGRGPDSFVMVGDREHDIIGARANAVDCVGVSYGAGSRQELADAGATHVVDSLAELEALLLA